MLNIEFRRNEFCLFYIKVGSASVPALHLVVRSSEVAGAVARPVFNQPPNPLPMTQNLVLWK
jgi:hypothetical protein